MSRSDKAAKRKKKAKDKEKRKLKSELRMPSVDFCACSEPEFDAALKEQFQKFRRTPDEYLSPFYIRLFRSVQNRRLEHSEQELQKYLNEGLELLSRNLWNALPPDIVKEYCPDNSFSVTMTRKLRFLVTYTQIIHQSAKEGAIHFSSKMPKVTLNRLPAKIAFTTHAFDRIVERCLTDTNSYYGISMIHSLFGGKLVFKPYNEELVQIYFMVWPARMGLPHKKGVCWVLVGYCPVEFCFGQAAGQTSSWLAKTLLVVGMKNTPERRLINQLPNNLKTILHQRLEGMVSNCDVHLFLWFQYNNCPCLYDQDKKGELTPLPLIWDLLNQEGLSKCKTPAESLEFFFKKDLQKYLEGTTILLP